MKELNKINEQLRLINLQREELFKNRELLELDDKINKKSKFLNKYFVCHEPHDTRFLNYYFLYAIDNEANLQVLNVYYYDKPTTIDENNYFGIQSNDNFDFENLLNDSYYEISKEEFNRNLQIILQKINDYTIQPN